MGVYISKLNRNIVFQAQAQALLTDFGLDNLLDPINDTDMLETQHVTQRKLFSERLAVSFHVLVPVIDEYVPESRYSLWICQIVG